MTDAFLSTGADLQTLLSAVTKKKITATSCVMTQKSAVILFLGAFAKLRNAIVIFVISVCPSIRPPARPHGTARFPLDGLL
jgi:hypothetical protein